ncbi:lactoylglutathione lyase [Bacteroidales bacterium Barb6XT]|nr:lactoylglutathione lyase [Bacteroidales bacterium Barb6XT]
MYKKEGEMKIDHIALWVADLEAVKDFYVTRLGGKAGGLYHNPANRFTSCFISFGEGCRLELMHRPDITSKPDNEKQHIGLTHFSVSVGSKEAVRRLTEQLRTDGYTVASDPRTTGDGYYESVILDPEGNSVEITANVT